MNKINQLFQQKQKEILSVYFTAGFPQLNDTGRIIKALQANGIHMIEVGIPFSDPMADGPVIQESSTIALRNGMNLKLLFSQLAVIAGEIHIPLIMMGYLNPIMQYGFEKFCRDCRATGISGIIIPDLPFNDYLNTYKLIADSYNLRIIMLITPETSEERIRLIDTYTEGFIYMVSSAATTGAQKSFDEKKQSYFRRINNMGLRNPRLIGFGISNKETLDAAFENASGAIIGSKFISLLREEKGPEEAVSSLLQIIFNRPGKKA
jgi:tryptophan synthase alpha chain